MTNGELIAELERRFPWLADPDEDTSGADTVDALAEWHEELKQDEQA